MALDRRDVLAAMGLGLVAASVPAAFARYDDPDALYRALREQTVEVVAFAGGRIDLVFADGARGVDHAAVRRWIDRNAKAMIRYFGRFPVARLGLLVIAQSESAVGHATTYGYGGPAIRIHVGIRAGDVAFSDDWVLAHEMLHAALPGLPRRALWLQEGGSTWLEPVARVRAGQLAEAELWRQAVLGMPRGEPAPSDGGMDGTRDHDRLYWGGATFWLLAELAVDRASAGRSSLRQAMVAINRSSGGNHADWSPERMMAVGDAAIGQGELTPLYRRFAADRIATDLHALFDSLGVMMRNGSVAFDERAPLAEARRRIVGRA